MVSTHQRLPIFQKYIKFSWWNLNSSLKFQHNISCLGPIQYYGNVMVDEFHWIRDCLKCFLDGHMRMKFGKNSKTYNTKEMPFGYMLYKRRFNLLSKDIKILHNVLPLWRNFGRNLIIYGIYLHVTAQSSVHVFFFQHSRII